MKTTNADHRPLRLRVTDTETEDATDTGISQTLMLTKNLTLTMMLTH